LNLFLLRTSAIQTSLIALGLSSVSGANAAYDLVSIFIILPDILN
jgi:hypothetical protein